MFPPETSTGLLTTYYKISGFPKLSGRQLKLKPTACAVSTWVHPIIPVGNGSKGEPRQICCCA